MFNEIQKFSIFLKVENSVAVSTTQNFTYCKQLDKNGNKSIG